MNILPDSKPKITKLETEKIVKHFLGANVPSLVLVGIRGYYSKTMGQTEGNDINLYDDAIIVWGLDTLEPFNANTDPSYSNKDLAMLDPGVYKFYRGKHRGQYNALRAFPEGVKLPCTRDGERSLCSAINIHYGGLKPPYVTWSAGCQTIPKPQWEGFIHTVYNRMLKNNQKTVTYILITQEQMTKLLS
jgi:hypothetical protein